jgi:uncharacterized protein (DUF1499 family)
VSLREWFTKNLWVTTPDHPDPFFRPRRYACPKAEVAEKVSRVLEDLPGWKLEEYRENQGRFHAVRRAFPWNLTADVHIYVVQGLDGTTKLEAVSRSRTGRGDFGRNKRNLREFLARMDRILPPAL